MFLHQHNQTQRHQHHPGDQAVDRQMVFAVFPGRWQQLIERDKDHDPGDAGKKDAENSVVEKGQQDKISDNRPDRLSHPRKQRLAEGFFAGTGRTENRNRH